MRRVGPTIQKRCSNASAKQPKPGQNVPPRRSPRISLGSPGVLGRIVKASMGQSPGGTERPEYADGTKFEAMKASYEQALHDVNPVTPPTEEEAQGSRARRPLHARRATHPRHAAVNKLFMSCT